MSSFLDEEVPPVDPLGVPAISELGRCFLEHLAPEVLLSPQRLDVLDLVDTRLPKFGIHVCPASREEIGNRDGATDPHGSGEVTILVSEEVWDQLELSGPRSYYARSTVCHELGHAVIHVPVLRRRLLLTNVLARTRRSNLRAYNDPEWQAWAFSGAILMPTVTLLMLHTQSGGLTTDLVSHTFEVSKQMASNHLKRLKLVSEG
jgi:IrrE N-terminal-like domain